MQGKATTDAAFPIVRSILRHRGFYLLITAVALGMRMLFVFRWATLTPDSFVYGDLAKNWLQHGIYGLSGPGGVLPTYIRMPGYPAFLAACFAVFGNEHYTAVLVLQALIDVITCFVIADLAMRTASDKAARIAFFLAATCIFMANYAAAALTETLAMFTTAAALDFAAMGLQANAVTDHSRKIGAWLACAVAVAAGILLRPDSGVLLAALLLFLSYQVLRRSGRERNLGIAGMALLALVALLPLAPWALRNWLAFHKFEPLTPFYATDASEPVPRGVLRWQKTWIVDYASTEDVWFHVPDEPISPEVLPARAFDSAEQQQRTQDLLGRYNSAGHLTTELDDEFGRLANERIAAHPLRYYVVFPVARVADMWLRPRTEMLPIDPHWWQFELDPPQSAISIGLAALNLFYIVAAALALRSGRVQLARLFLMFFLLRSLLLATMPAPEQRYTMECLPALLVLASAGLAQPASGLRIERITIGSRLRLMRRARAGESGQ